MINILVILRLFRLENEFIKWLLVRHLHLIKTPNINYKKLQHRGCIKLIDIWSSQSNSNPTNAFTKKDCFKRQRFIYILIKHLYDIKGWAYGMISKWLNQSEIKTHSGKNWIDS